MLASGVITTKASGRSQHITERKHMSTQKQYNGLLELDEKLDKVEIEINETRHNLFSLEDKRKKLLEIINRMDSETN